jgi:hypothetical protein
MEPDRLYVKNCPANKGACPPSGRTSSGSCGNCTSSQVSAAGQACGNCPHGKHHNNTRCYNSSGCRENWADTGYWASLIGYSNEVHHRLYAIDGWMRTNC